MAGKQFKDISAVATTLTVDPITPNILISQLNHNCGYEVIPNFKETLLYDPWEMVFALLPHS